MNNHQVSNARQTRAVVGLGFGYVSQAILLVLGLVITPFILGKLGRTGYGVWAVLGQIVGYIGLTDMGLEAGLMAFLSRDAHKRDWAAVNALASTSTILQIGFGVLGLVLALLVLPFIDRWFDIGSVPFPVVATALLIVVFSHGVKLAGSVYDQVLYANHRIYQNYLIGFLSQIFRILLVVGLLAAGTGLTGLALAALAGQIFSVCLWARQAHQAVPGLQVHPKYFSLAKVKSLLGFSIWGTLGRIAATIIYNTDNIIIGTLIGLPAVTTYVLTRRIFELLRQNVFRIGHVLRPGVGNLLGEGNISRLRQVFLKSVRTYLTIAAAGGIFLAFLANRLIALWVGAENYGGEVLVWITVASTIAMSLFHVSSIFLVADLQVKAVGLARLAESGLNLGLSVLFVKMGWGLAGVAVGTLLATVFTNGWYVPWRAARRCRVRLGAFLRESMLPAALAALIAAGLGMVLRTAPILNRPSWTSLAAYAVALGVVLGPVIVVLGLSREQQRLVAGLAGRVLPGKWVRQAAQPGDRQGS
ncbi:MAG TPA: oligosaccharide flippase family protein [Kiritimatiellia bacterium]|nr:oligosaccharide flippase family protein [Kiritimatiellia bacterium]